MSFVKCLDVEVEGVESCQIVTQVMAGLYLSSTVTMYVFLTLRASLIEQQGLSPLEKKVRLVVSGLLALAPLYIVWFALGTTAISVKGTCSARITTVHFLAFIPYDCIISALLVYLFWSPLRRMTKSSTGSAAPAKRSKDYKPSSEEANLAKTQTSTSIVLLKMGRKNLFLVRCISFGPGECLHCLVT